VSTDVERLLTAVVTIMLGIIGVAFLTALVSKQSDTSNVIGAFSGGFACALRTAITGKNECGGSIEDVTSSIKFPPMR
jgi:PRD1 phage membrane DNA delivery